MSSEEYRMRSRAVPPPTARADRIAFGPRGLGGYRISCCLGTAAVRMRQRSAWHRAVSAARRAAPWRRSVRRAGRKWTWWSTPRPRPRKALRCVRVPLEYPLEYPLSAPSSTPGVPPRVSLERSWSAESNGGLAAVGLRRTATRRSNRKLTGGKSRNILLSPLQSNHGRGVRRGITHGRGVR